MGEAEWVCAAYGADGRGIGAVCFVSGELHVRVCASLAECRRVMAAERQHVFDRIREGAAAGDPDMVFLAGEFAGPDELLGGGGTAGDSSEEENG